MSQVDFHSMPCVSLEALHEPSDRAPVGRLESVPEMVACINVREVYVPLVSVQQQIKGFSVGDAYLMYPQ